MEKAFIFADIIIYTSLTIFNFLKRPANISDDVNLLVSIAFLVYVLLRISVPLLLRKKTSAKTRGQGDGSGGQRDGSVVPFQETIDSPLGQRDGSGQRDSSVVPFQETIDSPENKTKTWDGFPS